MIIGLTITCALVILLFVAGWAFGRGKEVGYAEAIADVKAGDFDFGISGKPRPPQEKG